MPGCGPPGVYLAGRLAPDKRAALVGAIVKSGAAQARDLTRDVRLVVLQGEAAPKVLLARDKWGVPVVLAADAAALDAALQAAARSTVAPRHLTTALDFVSLCTRGRSPGARQSPERQQELQLRVKRGHEGRIQLSFKNPN